MFIPNKEILLAKIAYYWNNDLLYMNRKHNTMRTRLDSDSSDPFRFHLD